jgi:hypothetical protein
LLSARRRGGDPLGMASRSRRGSGCSGVDVDEGKCVVELPEGVVDVEDEVVELSIPYNLANFFLCNGMMADRLSRTYLLLFFFFLFSL